MDFYPSIVINNLALVCALVTVPRSQTSKNFRLSYPKAKEALFTPENAKNAKAGIGADQILPPITKDSEWCGPITDSAYPGKTLHRIGMCIPLPFDLFRRSPSRQFNIDASIEVSIANGAVVSLSASKTVEFSHFVKIGVDDSVRCRLFD